MGKEKVFKREGHGIRAYLGDFQQTLSGEYIYTGATYSFSDASGRTRKSVIRRLWLFGALMLAAAVAPGCIPAGGMLFCAYVLIPFGGTIICAGCTVWALIELSSKQDPLREYEYASTVSAIPKRALATAIFAAAGCIGEIVFILLHSSENTAAAWFIAVLLAVVAAVALLMFRTIRAETWDRTEAYQ